MSQFRSLKKLLTEGLGTHTDGIWVPGTHSVSTVLCSVQPVVKATDLVSLPEGRHLSDYVKVYTDTKLKIAEDGTNVQSDIIVNGDFGYEIVDVAENQSNVIPHYRYIAYKIFRFTNDNAWITGTLKRP